MNGRLADSDLFYMFTQPIKLYIFHYNVLKVQMFENVIHQIDSKNEWLLLSASFMAKLELFFLLTFENAFS